MPLGPKQSVNAILDVKGGEISGRSVTALIKKVSHFGSDRRVTAKAKMNPMIVPAKPTAQAKIILLNYGATVIPIGEERQEVIKCQMTVDNESHCQQANDRYRTNTPMASQRTQMVSKVTRSLCCLFPLVI